MTTLTEQQLIGRLRVKCKGGLRAFCREHSLDSGNVSKILMGTRGMSPQVARALGYERVVRWRKIG